MGSIHSCVSSLKHIHFAIINHFLFNCNVSKMAAHSERKTQTANFRAVQNFAKSNWQETAQLHTFAHSVTNIQFTSLEFFSYLKKKKKIYCRALILVRPNSFLKKMYYLANFVSKVQIFWEGRIIFFNSLNLIWRY